MFIKKKKVKIIIQVSAPLQFPEVTLLGKAKTPGAESPPRASAPSPALQGSCGESKSRDAGTQAPPAADGQRANLLSFRNYCQGAGICSPSSPLEMVPGHAECRNLTLEQPEIWKVKFKSAKGLFFPRHQSNLGILCPEKVLPEPTLLGFNSEMDNYWLKQHFRG